MFMGKEFSLPVLPGLILGLLFTTGVVSGQTVTVSGKVRDAVSAAPVADATVAWGQVGTSEYFTQKTGGDGGYSFTHRAAPDLWIKVTHPDYFSSGVFTFPVPAGEPIVQDVTLDPLWGAVRGRVVGNMPDGSRPALVDAFVEIWYDGQLSTSVPWTKTDADGRFGFPRLRDSRGWDPRKHYTLVIKNHPDYFPVRITNIFIRGGYTNVYDDLKADPLWGVVRGRITTTNVDGTVSPVEGASVELFYPDQLSTTVPSTLTEADGRYTFPRVRDSQWDVREGGRTSPRAYFLDVTHKDFFPDRGRPIGFVQGGRTNVVDVVLQSAFGVLEGTVYGLLPSRGYAPQQAPLANVGVEVSAGSFWRATTTDTNGHYRFGRLLATDYSSHTFNPNRAYMLRVTSGAAGFERDARTGIIIEGGQVKRADLHLEMIQGTLKGRITSAANN